VTQNRKYLDPVFLSKLGNMDLVARCAVEGFFAGLHPSPFHGFSVEYSDHREYHAGDELKFVDWKVFGRSDKLYIKQFQQETNTTAYILLDSSNSMSFSGAGSVRKIDYGSFLAAALAYLMLSQSDSTALILFAEKVIKHIPPMSRRTHLSTILAALQHNKPAGQTNLGGVLHAIAETMKRRGLVILISDLLDDQGDIYKGLAHLKFFKHDVIVFDAIRALMNPPEVPQKGRIGYLWKGSESKCPTDNGDHADGRCPRHNHATAGRVCSARIRYGVPGIQTPPRP